MHNRYQTLSQNMNFILFIYFFYSSKDASQPEIYFWYTVYFPGPVQETVIVAGFDLGTAA
jgi:hypothetical protein